MPEMTLTDHPSLLCFPRNIQNIHTYMDWIGHVTRQEASIAKTAMHWTPEGKRKRGRPKITWRRTVEKEIKEMGKTWEGIKFMARDHQMWREHVAALHAC